MQSAPNWENYAVAQAVQASLGLIPKSAVAVGVLVDGARIHLTFQLTGVDAADVADMDDIQDGLMDLVGDAVTVQLHHEIVEHRDISSSDRVRWIYLSRME